MIKCLIRFRNDSSNEATSNNNNMNTSKTQNTNDAKGKHTNSTALLEDYDVVHGPDGHEEGALGVAYKSCEPLGKPLSL